MLGGNAGAVAPAGLNLSGLLPSGGLLPGALPGAAQAAPHPGQHAGGAGRGAAGCQCGVGEGFRLLPPCSRAPDRWF